MSENKWLARSAAALAAVFMLMPCAGCSGNQGSSDAGQTGNSAAGNSESSVSSAADNNDPAGSEKKKREVPLTDEQKKAAEDAGISEDRYCTDNTEITKTAEDLLSQYCEGMANADHDKCFGVFPSFYKKAVEDENKSYGETNEQFMQSIKKNFADSCGDDFYIFTTVKSVLQLSDESLENTEERLKKSFSDDIVLDDLYYVYFTENVRGSQKKTSDEMEFFLLVIDGKSYLYDDYYEVYDEEDTAANEIPAAAGQTEAAKETGSAVENSGDTVTEKTEEAVTEK